MGSVDFIEINDLPIAYYADDAGNHYDLLELCVALGDEEGNLADKYLPVEKYGNEVKVVSGQSRRFINQEEADILSEGASGQPLYVHMKTKKALAEKMLHKYPDEDKPHVYYDMNHEYGTVIGPDDQEIDCFAIEYRTEKIPAFVWNDSLMILPTRIQEVFFPERSKTYFSTICYDHQKRTKQNACLRVSYMDQVKDTTRSKVPFYELKFMIDLCESRIKKDYGTLHNWLTEVDKTWKDRLGPGYPVRLEENPVVKPTVPERFFEAGGKVFTSEEQKALMLNGKRIRYVTLNGEPMFFRTDVARALGYRNVYVAHRYCRSTKYIKTKNDYQTENSLPLELDMAIINWRDFFRMADRINGLDSEVLEDFFLDNIVPLVRNVQSMPVQTNVVYYNEPDGTPFEELTNDGVAYRVPKLHPAQINDPVLKQLRWTQLELGSQSEKIKAVKEAQLYKDAALEIAKSAKEQIQAAQQEYDALKDQCYEVISGYKSDFGKLNERLREASNSGKSILTTIGAIADFFGIRKSELNSEMVRLGRFKFANDAHTNYALTDEFSHLGQIKYGCNEDTGERYQYILLNYEGVVESCRVASEVLQKRPIGNTAQFLKKIGGLEELD